MRSIGEIQKRVMESVLDDVIKQLMALPDGNKKRDLERRANRLDELLLMTDLTPLHGSSRLRALGYDPETRILKVRFPNDAVYQYMNVPPEVHEKLLAAHRDPNRSLGQEFNALVIKGDFKYEKL